MKSIKYFIKEYIFDFIGGLLTIIAALLSIFISNSVVIGIISAILAVSGLLLIIYFRLKNKDFYYLGLKNRKNIENWLGKGMEFYKSTQCFVIKNADPGIIFAPTLTWSDYTLNFKFKIESEALGIIIRAVNLSNYLMIQIGNDSIRPHIKVNGGWSVFEDSSFKLDTLISSNNWYYCTIKCENDKVRIKIASQTVIFDRTWNIPQGTMLVEFTDDKKEQGFTPASIKIPFPINAEYGAIGFRNFGNEMALVKELLIEKI